MSGSIRRRAAAGPRTGATAMRAAALILVLGAAVGAQAGEGFAAPDSALAVTLARLPGEPITLAEAVREALARDTAVAMARADLAAARGAERRQRGDFAPELFGSAEWSGDNQPTASFFAGADLLETERLLLGGGARLRLPLGTELAASVQTMRLSTNSAFATLAPQYDAYGELSVVQPLLRGFGPAARSEVEAAVLVRLQAEHQLDDARLATMAEVEVLYWALHAAERDLAVLSLIRDQAASFLGEVRLRARAGLVGPAEEASARVFLAQQEQALLDGEESLERLSDRLAVRLGRRPRTEGPRFRPTDRPPDAAPEVDVAQLIALATVRSHRVAAAAAALDAARVRADGQRWRDRPQLDLAGTLGGRGLAGRGREVVVDFGGEPTVFGSDLATGLGESVRQVMRRTYPSWSVGLVFSLPLGGGSEAGEHDRLRAEVLRAEQQLDALRRNLEAEVRSNHRTLLRSRQRLGHAAAGVEASLEQVRIGTLLFQGGRATAFELVRLAADLADAQRRYSEALVRTASATANLRWLTGGAYPRADCVDSQPEATAP